MMFIYIKRKTPTSLSRFTNVVIASLHLRIKKHWGGPLPVSIIVKKWPYSAAWFWLKWQAYPVCLCDIWNWNRSLHFFLICDEHLFFVSFLSWIGTINSIINTQYFLHSDLITDCALAQYKLRKQTATLHKMLIQFWKDVLRK